MNTDEILKKIDDLDLKISEVRKSVNQIKNYFKWVLIISIVLFVLPLIGLLFAIPSYLKTLQTITSF